MAACAVWNCSCSPDFSLCKLSKVPCNAATSVSCCAFAASSSAMARCSCDTFSERALAWAAITSSSFSVRFFWVVVERWALRAVFSAASNRRFLSYTPRSCCIGAKGSTPGMPRGPPSTSTSRSDSSSSLILFVCYRRRYTKKVVASVSFMRRAGQVNCLRNMRRVRHMTKTCHFHELLPRTSSLKCLSSDTEKRKSHGIRKTTLRTRAFSCSRSTSGVGWAVATACRP